MPIVESITNEVNKVIDNFAVHHLQHQVDEILKLRKTMETWPDNQLKQASENFKKEIRQGKNVNDLITPAFAVACETARRILNKVPYEVQVLAGLVAHSGRVAEMKAGEGKTLMEAMPVYLNALTGKGVHLITTNDYLAERDSKLMGPLYNFLGLSVGFISSSMKNEERRKNYACDITYVTNQEIGFDYLRDNLVYKLEDRVLRPEHALHFGIIDEIDSILIDESRTPLIIAEPAKEEQNFYDKFNNIVDQLRENEDYAVDYKNKNITMTDQGLDKAEQILGEQVFSQEHPMFIFYLDVCLKAKILFERDRDYIVTDGGVEIVDEFTGRVLPGRRFTDGVHQAIEAKEGIKVKEGDKTQAGITFQNFFPKYEKLSGMSGTVMGARNELNQVYRLDVVQIPTHKPMVRKDLNDLFFKTQNGKLRRMAKIVAEIHETRQPILIGARNVETATKISVLLDYARLPHQLLTAKDHEAEAEKISHAGEPGMITVATNMAGRGTDILLGPEAKALGGLFVLGTERHESRRIDDQLIGRAGRQGDPGESQFLISMEDEIVQLFADEEIINLMDNSDILEDEYLSGKKFDRAFKRAQDFVESKNLDGRLYLYKYDSVTSFQRNAVYQLRDRLLKDNNYLFEFLNQSLVQTCGELLNLSGAEILAEQAKIIFHWPITAGQAEELLKAWKEPNITNEWFNPFFNLDAAKNESNRAKAAFVSHFRSQVAKIAGNEQIFYSARNLLLQIIDDNWSDELDNMEVLKEEASLFSYASEDPLIDYVLDGEKLFAQMEKTVKKQFLTATFALLEQQRLLV